MPLQDTFKKKTTAEAKKADTTKVSPISKSPKQDDLRFCMGQAAQNIGRPSGFSWRSNEQTYILTATFSRDARDHTWALHAGDQANLITLWTYVSSDPLLIESFLAQLEQQTSTEKAVIPESLRPGQADPQTSTSETMKGIGLDPTAPISQDEFTEDIEILSRIGYGGMGVIFKARRKDNGEIVALKVLHGHLLEDPENTKRFMQEASACIELKHRNLISVHEFGISKSGAPFMIMEYLEGKPLTALIEKQGRLELAQFINIFTQICDGLQFAHEQGIVHRDVKPSNIMVIKNEGGVETAKVLDFGIAKMRAETDQKNLTPTGNVLGSPAYIAPEQCAGEKASPSIDVYALGCVMYEALSGHPPFVHESAIKVLMMQLSDPAPALSSICPEGTVPPALESIIMRCLEKDPAARYSSASELDADLWEFAYLFSRGEDPKFAEEGAAVPLVDESSGPPATPQSPAIVAKAQSAESQAAAPANFAQTPSAIPLQATAITAQQGSVMQTAATVSAQAEPVQAERAQAPLTIRIRKCRSSGEMDGAWEGLSLAIKITGRHLPVVIFLDTDAVVLLVRPDVSACKFGLDVQVMRRISAMQGILQQLIKSGALVVASERWAKRGTEPEQLMPGVKLLNDDEICDLIINSRGSIIEY